MDNFSTDEKNNFPTDTLLYRHVHIHTDIQMKRTTSPLTPVYTHKNIFTYTLTYIHGATGSVRGKRRGQDVHIQLLYKHVYIHTDIQMKRTTSPLTPAYTCGVT